MTDIPADSGPSPDPKETPGHSLADALSPVVEPAPDADDGSMSPEEKEAAREDRQRKDGPGAGGVKA
jgi:hypothetical protein